MSTEYNLRAVVLPTNAEALIIWLWDGTIPDCLGFSVRRINVKTGEKQVLSSRLVRFKGEKAKKGAKNTLDTHPIQGCKWSDGKIVVGETYQWEVVPMLGKPGNLREGEGVLTKETTIGYAYGEFIEACFNRGHLVSTQALADMIGVDAEGKPDETKLVEAINDPNSAIAKWLGAGLYEFCMRPYEEAVRLDGHVYNMFYELGFPPFVEYLRQHPELWSMILGNAGKDDETNAEAAKILHRDNGFDMTRRFIPEGRGLAHNKAGVVTDAKDKPVALQVQSANPKATGFYAQSNHGLFIKSPELAAVAKDYYDRMLVDCDADPIQSDEFRAANREVMEPVILPDGTSVQIIFSPCMMEREKPRTGPDGKSFPLLDMAPTMHTAKEILMGAKQGIYGVAFYPGTPSVVDVISYIAYKRPSLPIRFTVSSTQALPRPPRKPRTGVKGSKSIVDTGEGHPEAITEGVIQAAENGLILPESATAKPHVAVFQPRKKFPTIIAASALEDGFEDWIKELLKISTGHAVTHAKFVAVDPWGENPVLLGAASDNMGLRAAACNDEMFLVIRNNRALVQAYASFAMAVNSHFMWRYLVKTGQATFTGELAIDTSWQDRFLKGKTRKEYEQMLAG